MHSCKIAMTSFILFSLNCTFVVFVYFAPLFFVFPFSCIDQNTNYLDAIWHKISNRFETIANVTATLLPGISAKMELDYSAYSDLCAVFIAWYAHVIGHSNGRIYEPVSWEFVNGRFVPHTNTHWHSLLFSWMCVIFAFELDRDRDADKKHAEFTVFRMHFYTKGEKIALNKGKKNVFVCR